MNNQTNRIAVFVDGSNFFYLQKETMQWWVDPKKMLAWLEDYGQVVDATYYASSDPDNEKQVGFLRALTNMGYSVYEKPVKYNQEGGAKYHLNVDIIVDMMRSVNNYDMVVLVSGDASFVRVLEYLKEHGKRFMILSSHGSVAKEIQQLAGKHYVDFDDIRDIVEKN